MLEPFIQYSITILIFLGLGSFLTLGIAAAVFWYRSKEHFKKAFDNAKNLAFFKVKVPEDNEVEVKSFEQFYTTLLGIKDIGRFDQNNSPHISLEIVGNEENINFYVVCPKSVEDLVEKAIHSVYSDAEILKGKEHFWNIWDKEGHQEFAEMYLNKESHYPLNTYEETEVDPLSAVTSSMSKMREGQALALQILIRPADSYWKDRGKSVAKYLTNKEDSEGNPTSTDEDREKADIIKSKTKKEGFESVLRLISVAENKDKAKVNLNNLKNALGTMSNPQGNSFTTRKIHFKDQFLNAFIFRVFPYFHIRVPYLNQLIYKAHSVLNTKELATLFHFPNKDVKTPGINWLRAKSSLAPSDVPDEGLYLGYSEFRGVTKKVHMKQDDRRRHMYVLGQTGAGKSELMKFLAVQDINQGKGVAFIDPHGAAVRDILKQIPEERTDDVIYFNPGDEEYPMGLNILDVETDRARNLVVNSFIDLLYKLYDPNRQGMVGPRLERAVRNAMLTVMEAEPGGTMIEVMRVLMDEDYQKELVEKVKDPLVKRYWLDEVANTQKFHKSETLGYFVSKFDRFVTEKVMRNIMGQSKSSFDFQKVMEDKKILLVDLNKGAIGEENSKFLGLLIVPRLLAAAFSRGQKHDESNLDDFYLYVDEFQNFSTPDFVTILSEARKYKLNLTVANQFLGQMEDDIKDAIFGNVGTLVSFRVGPDDAKYMAEQFSPTFDEGDLINFKVGNAALRLLVDSQPTVPFSLTTDWDAMVNAQRSEEMANRLVKESREKYAKPLKDVEKEIDERSNLSDFGNSKGSKKSKFSSKFKSPFSSKSSKSSFSSRFGKNRSKKDSKGDKEFKSGDTPFSKGNSENDNPFPRFGNSNYSSKSRPKRSYNRPGGDMKKGNLPSSSSKRSKNSDKKQDGSKSPSSFRGRTGSSSPGFERGYSMENIDSKMDGRTRGNNDGSNEGVQSSSWGSKDSSEDANPKRGVISLGDIQRPSNDKKREYKESNESFSEKGKDTKDKIPPRLKSDRKVVEDNRKDEDDDKINIGY